MRALRNTAIAAGAALALTACMDLSGPADFDEMGGAFSSVLLGFDATASSFQGGPDGGGAAWAPPGMQSGLRGPGGGGGRPGGGRSPAGGMMGGGLHGMFAGGGLGFGGRQGDPSLPATCTFNAASGRVECPAETRNGLTINRSAAYLNAAGGVQQSYDSATTNTINTRTSVSGTATQRNGNTSVVQHASDRTVAGLAPGSAQRTINSTSGGSENTTGTNRAGAAFSAQRVMGDSVRNVVIPAAAAGAPTYPIAGTVTRAMQATITVAGGTPTTSSRREVITFNGSATATIVITHDGTTKTCQLPLPHGRPVCP